MAEKISELTGAAREQRVAELKAKMQAAAARAQANYEATGSPSGEAAATPVAEPEAVAVAAQASAVAEVTAEASTPVRTAVAPARPAPSSDNGAAAPKPAPAKPRPAPAAADGASPELSPAELNRREFLVYAWGGALGLLTLQFGVASYFFMYPRFRAGEFGGQFFLPESTIPPAEAPPEGNSAGKFWLVTTAEGEPRALYMVCTHLGCLYKWEPSTFRFECPCHGTKFTKDGLFIEGPAPRSLDYFDLSIEDGSVIVDTGRRINGGPAAESPARIEI